LHNFWQEHKQRQEQNRSPDERKRDLSPARKEDPDRDRIYPGQHRGQPDLPNQK
jgi:hypothetical protein